MTPVYVFGNQLLVVSFDMENIVASSANVERVFLTIMLDR